MAILLLDTTVLIDALRGRSAADKVRALRVGGDLVVTSPVNVEEIHRGVRVEELAVVRRLFAGLLVVPIGQDEGARAGQWRREFATRGITLSQSDCLVAATAVSVGARLATANVNDFPMADVDVDHWPTG